MNQQQQVDPKKAVRLVLIGIIILIPAVLFFMSWQDVAPGEEGFIFRPYAAVGINTDEAPLTEGTYLVAPWNEMITYSVRESTAKYNSTVMDINGTNIEVDIAVRYSVSQGKSPELHKQHGRNYIEFINDKSKGAIKDVIGRYTYEQVYSSKREALEGEIEDLLRDDFSSNFIFLAYVEIADVNLPQNIAQEITNKETQKQRNLTAQQKAKEQEFLANARIEEARGDSSLVISARYKAEAIGLEAEQIAKNPKYIELKKWEAWDGKGSPYGQGNVYGSNAVSILKQ